jgi:hypothetical protein
VGGKIENWCQQAFYCISEQQRKQIRALKCPFCAKEMTPMKASVTDSSVSDQPGKQETIYYCQEHGVMNKSSDLRERVNQIAKRT